VVRNPGKQKDRAVIFMSVYVYPVSVSLYTEYRGIRTVQYTYVKTPDEATMLFDNRADPYQLNNLVGKPEAQKLQIKLDRMLAKELKAIGDEDFKYKQFYLDKWGYDLSEGRFVPSDITPGKITRVYTPQKTNK